MQYIHPYFNYIFSCIIAVGVSMFSIPNIIYVAKRKRLLDMPDNERKLHKRIVPNLGGIGIFFSYIIVTSLFMDAGTVTKWNYITASLLILFITGIKDDLVQISASKKFLAQFAAAVIIVWFADIRISSLHGFLNIYQLPLWFSVAFSIIGCIFVTNAFNLIDGIDGLAGTIGVFICTTFGILLAMQGNSGAAIMAFSLVGAILGFLRYNISPAKIFMGDTGSLIIGFSVAALGILFINSYQATSIIQHIIPTAQGSLLIALSILFIPVFDTFRVFTIRILKGKSPFSPDRRHLHHYLLDLGLSHNQTVFILLVANILIVALSFGVQRYNINLAIASLLFVSFGLFSILYFLRRAQMAQPVHSVVTSMGNTTDNYFAPSATTAMHTPIHHTTSTNNVIVSGKKIHIDEPEEALLDQ